MDFKMHSTNIYNNPSVVGSPLSSLKHLSTLRQVLTASPEQANGLIYSLPQELSSKIKESIAPTFYWK
jgi:hypothetical protein